MDGRARVGSDIDRGKGMSALRSDIGKALEAAAPGKDAIDRKLMTADVLYCLEQVLGKEKTQ